MGELARRYIKEPDAILLGKRIITLWPGCRYAEAVSIRDGLIQAVGNADDLLASAGRRTSVIDCRDKYVVPGFRDAHLHLLACASKRLSLDCGPSEANSITEIQQKIRERSRLTPEGSWIRCGNYDEFRLAEKRHPTRWDLDLAAPKHPVKLQHRSLHACVLNSYALGMLTGGGSSLPFTGAVMEIDQLAKEPSGLVFENGSDWSSNLIPPVAEKELMSSLDEVFRELLANGITSVEDATVNNNMQGWRRFREICAVTRPRPRIGFMVGQAHLSEFIESGLGPGDGDEWLAIGPVKIMLTETADSFMPTLESLKQQIGQAQRHGFQVAIHATEESAVCVAIEALSETANEPGFRPHRIEHGSVVPPGLVERLAELKVAVVTQPGFLYESGDRYLSEVEAHLQGWLYPIKSLLDQGVIVGAGSDAPVAPAVPLQGIRAAASRLSREGSVVGPKERLSSEEALRLYTSGAARASGEFARAGSIEPGKLADMVVLSEDLTVIDPTDIDEVPIEMTVVNGQVAWQKAAK